jgi:hypothetical protein
MNIATTSTSMTAPAPLEMPGSVAHVPSLDEIDRLTDVPDRRVVFRGVDWAFYEWILEGPRSERDWIRWARAEIQRKRGGEPR